MLTSTQRDVKEAQWGSNYARRIMRSRKPGIGRVSHMAMGKGPFRQITVRTKKPNWEISSKYRE